MASPLCNKLSTLRQLYTGTSHAGNLLQCLENDRLCSWRRPVEYRQNYLDKKLATTDHMYSVNVIGHCGCVNALAFSNIEQKHLVTAGDDERVLVWRVADIMEGRGSPTVMKTRHQSNIFSVVCSYDDAFIFSAGNDSEVIKHDFATGQIISSYRHLDAVYCVAAHPSDSAIITTASEDGCVYIIDTRKPTRHLNHDMVLTDDTHAFHSVDINPVEPHLVAVCSADRGTLLYDARMENLVMTYKSYKYATKFTVKDTLNSGHNTNVMTYKSSLWNRRKDDAVSVCFNSAGTQLFALRKRQPPCLYNLWEEEPLFSFFDSSGGYKNSITMKSGCFMGHNDEYVVSGSDDFRIYVWKIPPSFDLKGQDEKSVSEVDPHIVCAPHLVLPGHRSVVNQVRYSKVYSILASSGVEKTFKLWSHLPLPPLGEIRKSGDPPSRRRFSPLQILQRVTNDENMYSNTPHEDPSVWAMFDSFIEQDAYNIISDTSASPSSIYSLNSSLSSDLDLFHPFELMPPFDPFDSTTSSSLSPANTSSIEPPWSTDEELEREVLDCSDSDDDSDTTAFSDDSSDSDKDGVSSDEHDDIGGEECKKVTRIESKQQNDTNGVTTESQSCVVYTVSSDDTLDRKRKCTRIRKSNPATYRKEDFLKSKAPVKFYSRSSSGPAAVSGNGECSAECSQEGKPSEAADKSNNDAESAGGINEK